MGILRVTIWEIRVINGLASPPDPPSDGVRRSSAPVDFVAHWDLNFWQACIALRF